MVISVPVLLDDDTEQRCFLQVLSLESRPLLVPTYRTAEDEDCEKSIYTMSVQNFEAWGSVASELDAKAEVDVYIFSEPEMVDLLGITKGTVAGRDEWHAWSTKPSDVDGCLTLFSPKRIEPQMKLSDPGIPVLSLLDTLHGVGWTEHNGKLQHTPGSAKSYDSRNLASSRPYLQCLVSSAELFGAGVTGFPSGLSSSYYKLLLATKRDVPAAVSAKECQKRLARLEGDVLELAALDREALPPADQPARPPHRPPALEDVDVAGDLPPDADDREVQGQQLDIGVAGDDVEEVLAMPESIAGCPIIFVKGRADDSWKYHDRWKVCCPNVEHGQCSKSRSVRLQTDIFGPRACEFFLHAWALKADSMSASEHRGYVPTVAEIRAVADAA